MMMNHGNLNMDSLFISGGLIFIIILEEKWYSNKMWKSLWVYSLDMTAALCMFKWFQGAKNS